MNKYVFLFLFALFSHVTWSQPDLKFKRYTANQGLIHNDILCVYQDSIGFMWFGTKKGCSRFDGIEFKKYQYDENVPGSIGEGWVNKIIADNKNGLWFALAGSGSTLMRYDYETEQFVDFSSFIKAKLNKENEEFSIWSVFCDSEGLIWFFPVSLDFMYYNPDTREIRTFNNYKNVPSSLFLTRGVLEDAKHNIWFATSKGLYIYNKKTDSFTSYKNNPDDETSISSDNCNSIFQDSEEQIWIGTNVGLNRVIQSSKSLSFERFVHEPQNPYSLSQNLTYDIAEDANNNLLIATVNGFCLMDKSSKKIYSYYNDEIDDESINSNIIRSVYCDNFGNVWVGTSSGVGKLQIKNFNTFSHSSYNNSISHNKVECLYEAPDANVWIATPKGIDVFNREKKHFTHVLGITQDKNGLYGMPITLCPDTNRGIWIGTHNGGLSYYNYVKNRVTNYITDSLIQFPNNIFSIFKDSKNRLWFDNQGKGVYVCDLELKKCRLLSFNKENENTLSSNWPRIITEDSESNIWIGTVNGLNKLTDFETGAFVRYLDGLEIYCIVEASDKSLWIGANKGLYHLDKSGRQLGGHTTLNGFPSNIVSGIVEDKHQNLWIGTDKELVRFKLNKELQAEITIYREDEGVAMGDFIPRSYAKLSDGAIMFGGTEGFLIFHPSDIKNDTTSPSVVFTNLKIAGKKVNVGQEINNQIVLKKSITNTNHLILNHKNNAFSIKFAGLYYHMPQYISYAYKLEGYEKSGSNWLYTESNDREAEYMNLPKGNYVFKVKASNSHGIWSEEVTQLKITILPPWWQTFWFKLLLIIAIVTFFVLILRIRTYNLQKQKLRLKKLVEKRTMELKEMNSILTEQKGQLEQQIKKTEEIAQQLHDADQSKLRFFANVSHEFRTPLSLIIGPLEKCLGLKDWSKEKVHNYHLLMHKNARRLLRLINQVLDFRKIDQAKQKLKVSKINVIEFVKEVSAAFSAQAENKNIRLETIWDEDEFKNIELFDSSSSENNAKPITEFWFDPDIMEKILYNLISNAVKYTNEGGEISIQLSVNSNQSYDSPLNTDNCLLITVKDTGIGIKQEDLTKIFDRFYRVESGGMYEGAGIGLAYTKELVELHEGIINVESVYGKGSSFIVAFPLKQLLANSYAFSEQAEPQSSEHKPQEAFNLNYIRSMIEEESSVIHQNRDNIYDDVTINEYKSNEEQKRTQAQYTILLVEDNSGLRSFIKSELEEKQYKVIEAENGSEGLEQALNNYPDLIISDIMMPKMDGFTLCKKVKTDEHTCHIPVILLTAKTEDRDAIRGLNTGADDYTTKPFNINILLAKVANLLENRRRLREKFSSSHYIPLSEITTSSIDEKFLEKIIAIIEENMQDPEFSNDKLIELLQYSRTFVYKKIKSLTNQSVSEFIRIIRLKKAAHILLQGEKRVAEAGYMVGFKNPNHFSAYFTNFFGKSPTQFIKDNSK